MAPVAATPRAPAPIGTILRLDPDDHEIMSNYARSKRMSIQQLLECAINAMRAAESLDPIRGRPRSKTRHRYA
jgi:predicted HicB family RNase H-like nuclease